MTRWIILILIYIIVDLYAFQVFRSLIKTNWIYIGGGILSFAVLVNFIYQFTTHDNTIATDIKRAYSAGFFLAVLIPKLLVIIFLFGEDLVRLFMGLYSKIYSTEQSFYIPSRRKFVGILALSTAAIPFASLLYGMARGKYNYKVLKYDMAFDDLPDAFDGYQITHISDIHCGSFDDKEKVNYGIDLINEQKSNAILFTGDLVNNLAEEIDPWKNSFSKLTAKDGVYSVLGNHDYGDYVNWQNSNDHKKNNQRIKDIQAEMGWKLLCNETHFVEKNGERLAFMGVENWGEGFKKEGDLDKAMTGVADNDFKILMSHDPSHWKSKVRDDKRNFHLTLSGHTHGMQFGIEIPGWIKWSPVKYRYEHWAGIYEHTGRYINVNRGFGFIGYPGRVGIWPEISVITLRKKNVS